MAALDTEVRRDLRGLQKDTADSVARHLVAAGSLVDEDPQLALEHARYARRRASRIAVVREAAGIAAYHAGEWAEALAELRAARRMGGGPIHLPVMADIERALGRPERAVDIARGTEAAELGTAGRIELAIVGAGARRDLGELEAAVVGLQIPELDPTRREPWSGRLFYAYADNLLAAGRESDALQWFVHAADADTDGETDAVGRIAELTGEDPDDADDFAFGIEEVAPEPAGRSTGATGGADAVAGEDPTGGSEPESDPDDADAGAGVAAGVADGVQVADELAGDEAAADAAPVDDAPVADEVETPPSGDVAAGDAVGPGAVVDPADDESAEIVPDGVPAAQSRVVEDVPVDVVPVEDAEVGQIAVEDAPAEEIADGGLPDGGITDAGTADEGSSEGDAPVGAPTDDVVADDVVADDSVAGGGAVGTEADGPADAPSTTDGEDPAR